MRALIISDVHGNAAALEHGRLILGRVEFPVDLTVGALEAADLPKDVVRSLADLLRSGRVPGNLDPRARAR